jgi:hypothetical protein
MACNKFYQYDIVFAHFYRMIQLFGDAELLKIIESARGFFSCGMVPFNIIAFFQVSIKKLNISDICLNVTKYSMNNCPDLPD